MGKSTLESPVFFVKLYHKYSESREQWLKACFQKIAETHPI